MESGWEITAFGEFLSKLFAQTPVPWRREGTIPCKCWDKAPGSQPVLG